MKRINTAYSLGGGLFAAALALVNSAHAAPISYLDQNGLDVIFQNIQEEALTPGDGPALFGPPSVSGNSLDFDPIGFKAEDTGGGTPDTTDGNLKFAIQAKAGKVISFINFAEAGDTTLVGPGTDGTFTSVTAFGTLDIHEVNGVGISTISTPFALTFTNGLTKLLTDGAGFFVSRQWNGSVNLDVDLILANNQIAGEATLVDIDMDNILVARSQIESSALIAKKNAGSVIITVNGNNPFPEPSCGLLSLIGFGLLPLRRRKV